MSETIVCASGYFNPIHYGHIEVCKTLLHLHPDIFTNGGDQNNDTIPEKDICEKMGTELVDNLGEKIQSSSWLLAKVNKKLLFHCHKCYNNK